MKLLHCPCYFCSSGRKEDEMGRGVRQNSMWEHLFFLGPATLLFFIIVFVPFVTGFIHSFSDWNGITKELSFIGLENYKNIFTRQSDFLHTFWFTLRFAIVQVVLVMVIGVALAVVLVMPLRFRDALRASFYLPQTIGGLVLGFIWQFIFINGFPAFGTLFHLDFMQLPWLGTEETAFTALIIVSTWQNVGYVMVIMTAALMGISRDVLESAEIDGAGTFRTLFRIKLPICMPFITVALFWSTANVFKMFELNLSLTKGGPYGSTVSMALGIYNDAFVKNRYGLASAESVIFFLIILIITSIQLFLSRKKEEAYS